MDKVFYNKSSADSLGWEPEWFGVRHHDEKLVKAIRKWQKDRGLTADGLCGPSTYRRIWTERDADSENIIKFCPPEKDQSFIICNSKPVVIDWPRVVLWNEDGSLKCKPGTYYDYAGEKPRKVNMFVNHWDVCLSSESCVKILNNRGISVHFSIDNDGTIYQLLDTQHGAWHAGVNKVNRCSVGVEISNAYYTKYQSWYVKNGFGERPVASGVKVHGGTLEDHLDFYPVQLDALAALWAAVSVGHDIPLEIAPEGRYDSSCYTGKFKGFVNHYNITKKKIDCAGLDMSEILRAAKQLAE